MKEPSVHDSCTSIDSLVYKKGNGIFILIIQNSNILDFNTNDASWWSLYHILVVVIYSDLWSQILVSFISYKCKIVEC